MRRIYSCFTYYALLCCCLATLVQQEYYTCHENMDETSDGGDSLLNQTKNEVVCDSNSKYCTINREKTVNFVALLNLCYHKGTFSTENRILLELIRKYVQYINYYQLPTPKRGLDIRLGYTVYDICGSSREEVMEMILSHLIRPLKQYRQPKQQLQSRQGCHCTNNTNSMLFSFVSQLPRTFLETILKLLTPYKYPVIQISAYPPDMSDHQNKLYIRPVWMKQRLGLILKLFNKFHWKYTALIISDDDVGEEDKKYLLTRLEQAGVHVAFVKYFRRRQNDTTLQQSLKENPFLKIVIVLLSAEYYKPFFCYVNKYGVENVTWVVNEFAVSTLSSNYIKSLNPNVIHGTIYLKRVTTLEKQFSNYIMKLLHVKAELRSAILTTNVINTLRTFSYRIGRVVKYWPYKSFRHFERFLLDNIAPENPDNFFYKLPYYLPRGSVWMINVSKTTHQKKVLLAYSLYFSLKGAYYKPKYYTNRPHMWAGYSSVIPTGKCADICLPGTLPLYMGAKKVCWLCQPCPERFFKNDTGNHDCYACPFNTEPNKNKTECLDYHIENITYDSNTAHIMYTIASSGFLLTAIVFFIIIYFRKTPVIRASNFPFLIVQLISHLLICCVPIVFYLAPQTQRKCIIEPVIRSVLFNMIVSVTFTKTNYLLEVFQCRKIVRKKTVMLRKYKQWVILWSFICCQVVIYAIHILYVPIVVVEHRYPDILVIQLSCGNTQHVIIQLMFIGLLLLGCAVQAFRARNLPGSYNEVHPIMYSTFIVSITFLISPVIQNSHGSIHENALKRQIISLISSLVILGFTFAPKCWIVLFQKDLNTKETLRSATFEAMKKSAMKRVPGAEL